MTPCPIYVYPAGRVPATLYLVIDQLAPRSQQRPFGIKEEKHRLGDLVRGVAPNWFAAVMGTGIVAIAAATLPLRIAGLHAFALAVWVLAAALDRKSVV